mgnify:CR=1 FL=1
MIYSMEIGKKHLLCNCPRSKRIAFYVKCIKCIPWIFKRDKIIRLPIWQKKSTRWKIRL